MALPPKALNLISSFLRPSSPPALPKHVPQTKVHGLVFSKDRPGQLFACLSSIALFVRGLDQLCVILKATTPDIYDLYQVGIARLEQHKLPYRVRFRWEDEDTFETCFAEFIEPLPSGCLVWFQVDDAIHYDVCDLTPGAQLLRDNDQVLNVHTKLWTLCTYSHPAGKTMAIPNLTPCGDSLVLFERQRGQVDWNYPFDLSGGLYRLDDLRVVLDQIGTDWTPNVLECELNRHGALMFGFHRPLSACVNVKHPLFSLVTINRVQTDFPNTPIYTTKYLDHPHQQLTQDLFTKPIDYTKYQEARTEFNSVHIESLFLLERSRVMDASVLIPARNAESSISRCLLSVIRAVEKCATSYRIQIVLVDDGSHDATAFVAQDIMDRHPHTPFRLVRRPRSFGVASCLNYGLRFIQSEVILRMDADDECLEDRFLAQLGEFQRRPRLGVLGCAAEIRNDPCTSRFAPTPTGLASNKWNMLFYCTLVHPTVAIRRVALPRREEVFPTFHAMEDYALWLEYIENGTWDLDNLQQTVGVVHFHQGTGVTGNWTERERNEQFALSLHLAQLKAPALEGISVEQWRALCTCSKQAIKTSPIGQQVTDLLAQGLGQLKEWALQSGASDDKDEACVKADYEARVIELLAT